MELLEGIAYFVFGTLIGSSLNVVILRYHSGSFFSGRSRCFSCGKTLKWFELIPIVSYLALRRRCRSCRSLISSQYILVETGTGLLFLFAYLKGFPGIAMPIALSLLSLLVAIFVYDLRHKIIPDGLVSLFIGVSFLQMFIQAAPFSFVLPSLSNLLAGPLLFVPFFALWFYSKGTWMGLGDGKLALGIGWYLGLELGTSAVVFAFWIGAAVSVGILLVSELLRRRRFFKKRRLTLKSEIPFAPFLIAGYLLVLYLEVNLWHFIL